MAAAFPSACGKTNLAMLVPPPSQKGWKVWTVGDDIAWMRIGPDGRLYAINPEAGFFGVAPGTSLKTNPNAMASLSRNAIFTNVAMTETREPWWEGMNDAPGRCKDWQGRDWSKGSSTPAAHANARFTAPARQSPMISPDWESPRGVPISALIFGGRRARTAPLVFEAFDWNHGVYVGASAASEVTAAVQGQTIGSVRRDPFAMLPFCGYNMADYFRHWLQFGTRSDRLPKLFHVNWFRTDDARNYLWPGFGENIRVLRWILGRCRGTAHATATPIGHVPAGGAIDLTGIENRVTERTLAELMRVERKDWEPELLDLSAFFAKFGDRLPVEIWRQHHALVDRFGRGTQLSASARR
jgi:phosphoenolpyruvate carboxykinase (GTP)